VTLELGRFREVFSKIPFGFLAPIFYFLFVSFILLYVALSPFVYLYGLLRCCEVWIDWARQGKDVLVIHLASDHSRDWISRLDPLTGGRAVFLNWSERKKWDRRSLAVQLFEVFGPHGMPEQFTAHSLPAVVVFRKLQRPKKFTFGEHCKDREGKLEELRAELIHPPTR